MFHEREIGGVPLRGGLHEGGDGQGSLVAFRQEVRLVETNTHHKQVRAKRWVVI